MHKACGQAVARLWEAGAQGACLYPISTNRLNKYLGPQLVVRKLTQTYEQLKLASAHSKSLDFKGYLGTYTHYPQSLLILLN